MKTVTTATSVFEDGDIVAHKLGAGAIVSLYLRNQRRWTDATGKPMGLTDRDMDNNLSLDTWAYVGNKYKAFL